MLAAQEAASSPGDAASREEWRVEVGSVGSVASGTTFGTQAGPPLGFTRLFVVLASSHLLFDATSLDQLTKPSYGLLNAFAIA